MGFVHVCAKIDCNDVYKKRYGLLQIRCDRRFIPLEMHGFLSTQREGE